ncbi:MAG: undecaprenyl-diphosphate phosphatase [Firmicutes bacterium]|nr:undecaprenyl-diphosphate phosphatase [Bacillota bacterium]MDY2719494.1 undecaprenyl-diphosphate phosphatase [Candidatus Faecousia sp.]
MNAFQAIVLGIIQGVAEFLPISSSGHLKIIERIMGLGDVEGNFAFFDVMLHFGTLVAVFIAYRKDIAELLSELLTMIHLKKRPQQQHADIPARRLMLMIVVSLLPLFLILPFKSKIEALGTGEHGMEFIGAALIVTGMLLYFSDRFAKGRKNEKNMTVVDALLVGAAQAVAVVPGLSRSGTTISAGMARGFDRTFAVRFSFLMSIPTVLAATLLQVIDAVQVGLGGLSIWACLLGMVVAGVCGYFAIRLLKFIAEKNRFGGFAYYCWAAGLVALILSLVS